MYSISNKVIIRETKAMGKSNNKTIGNAESGGVQRAHTTNALDETEHEQ